MKIFIIFGIAILLGGCGSPAKYQVPNVNLEVESYPSSSSIDAKDIFTNKPYSDVNRLKFVVLSPKNDLNYSEYKAFMKTSLIKIGFPKVLSETEFANLISEKRLAHKKDSLFDLEFLQKANKALGEFLVIKASLNHKDRHAVWGNQVEILDPESSETLLKFRIHKSLWNDIDKEFNYPAINLINDWYKSSKRVSK